LKRILLGVFLLIFVFPIILYYNYALYNFTLYPELALNHKFSIDDCCEFALKKTNEFEQLHKFEFEVNRISYTNYSNIEKENLEISLLGRQSSTNMTYILEFYYNLKDSKLEEINGFYDYNETASTNGIMYSSWTVNSKDAIKIYKDYLKQISNNNLNINRIDGYYDYTIDMPVWRIWGEIQLFVNPFSGEPIDYKGDGG